MFARVLRSRNRSAEEIVKCWVSDRKSGSVTAEYNGSEED